MEDEDEDFDNGIDGTEWPSKWADDIVEEETSEGYTVHYKDGLEVMGWPTYGNYTITTDTFHMYWYPGSRFIRVFDKRQPHERMTNTHKMVLELNDKDLYFFSPREKESQYDPNDGAPIFFTGEEVNRKIERYIALAVFL